MSLFDKLKKMDEEKKEKETQQCQCGSSLKGECDICDFIDNDDPILESIRKIGDEKAVNPPKPESANKAVKMKRNDPTGTCPTCEKEFKHLSRHRCKGVVQKTDSEIAKELVEEVKEVLKEEKPKDQTEGYLEEIKNQGKEEKIENDASYDLYINAEIVHSEYEDLKIVRLCDLVEPIIEAIAKENQVNYWLLLEFGKSSDQLATRLESYIAKGHLDCDAIVMSTSTKEGKACLDVLQRHAGFVVRGVI